MNFRPLIVSLLAIMPVVALAQTTSINNLPVPVSGSPNIQKGDKVAATRAGTTYGLTASFGANCAANRFVNGISDTGVGTCVQPNFTDLAGRLQNSQVPAFAGDITNSAGSNSLTVTDSAVMGKTLVGFSATPGSISASDTVLTAFNKLVGNANAGVTSVFGRTGAVTAQSGDYSFGQISGTLNAGTQVSGVLPVANGGTNSSTGNIGALLAQPSPSDTPRTIDALLSGANTAQFPVAWAGGVCDGTITESGTGTVTITPGTDISDKIQAAIDAASAAGGGTVVLPAGVCTAKQLNQKSYVTLAGAAKGIASTILTPPANSSTYILQSEGFGTYYPAKTAYPCDGVNNVPVGIGLRDIAFWGTWQGSGSPLVRYYTPEQYVSNVWFGNGNGGTYMFLASGPASHKGYFACKTKNQEESFFDHIYAMGGGGGGMYYDLYDGVFTSFLTAYTADYGFYSTNVSSIGNMDLIHTYAQTPTTWKGAYIGGSANIKAAIPDGTQIWAASGGIHIGSLSCIGCGKNGYPGVLMSGSDSSIGAGSGTFWGPATNAPLIKITGHRNRVNMSQQLSFMSTDSHNNISVVEVDGGRNNSVTVNCANLTAAGDTCVKLSGENNDVKISAYNMKSALTYTATGVGNNAIKVIAYTNPSQSVLAGDALMASDRIDVQSEGTITTSYSTFSKGTAAQPSIAFAAAPTTGLFANSASPPQIGFAINGAQKAILDQSGVLSVGSSSTAYNPSMNIGFGSVYPRISSVSTSNFITGLSTSAFSNDARASGVFVYKSRGGIENYAKVQDGDTLGGLYFGAADGSKFVNAANISSLASATATTNITPSRLEFRTTALDGTLTKALTIGSDQSLTAAGAVSAIGSLTVNTASGNTAVLASSAAGASPSLTTSGADTNVGLTVATKGTGKINFYTGGATKFFMDDQGNLGVNSSSFIPGFNNGSNFPIVSAGTTGSRAGIGVARASADNAGSYLFVGKTRGASIGAYDAVLQNDMLGGVSGQGASGSSYREGASLRFYADADFSGSVAPSRAELWTTNTSGTSAVRFSVGNSGDVTIPKLNLSGVVTTDSSGTLATSAKIPVAMLPNATATTIGAVSVSTGLSASSGALSVVYGTTATSAAVGNDARIVGAAQVANNLSDLASASTARTNLGLGTIATQAANSVAITGGAVSNVSLDLSAQTGALILPTGTAGQRPVSPSEGMLRENSATTQPEIYAGAEWTPVVLGKTFNLKRASGRLYPPMPGINTSSAIGAVATQNRLYCHPAIITRSVTIDALAGYVGSTAGSGSTSFACAYNRATADDLPGTLAGYSGVVATTSTSSTVLYTLSAALSVEPGVYWFCSAHTTSSTLPSMMTNGTGNGSGQAFFFQTGATTAAYALNGTANNAGFVYKDITFGNGCPADLSGTMTRPSDGSSLNAPILAYRAQ